MITFSLLAALCAAPQLPDVSRGATAVHYTIRAESIEGGADGVPLDVTMRIDHAPRGRCVVQIPVWTPGSYRLRDFPERVRDVRAAFGSTVQRLDRGIWELDYGAGETATVSYRVLIPLTSRGMVRGNRRRAITYEGPGVYLFVRGHLDAPCTVDFDLPDGAEVATGLVPRGPRSFFADGYDFLADCPVKLGAFQRFAFESHGKPIEVVVDGPGDLDFDSESWLQNIQRITDTQGDIFGGFPFDRYVFLYSASPRRGYDGGLEHLTSTMIGISANQLERSPMTGMGVTAHEFIHLWNVKRLRPIELGPFDYGRPVRTTSLWLAEGFTSYYTQVTLTRCGLADEAAFWRSMESAIRAIENNPARDHVSPATSSISAWDDPPFDRRISYYTSGQVLGLLLDLELRDATANRHGLDEFMRRLYGHCTTLGRGYRDDELPAIASAIAGRDLQPFFDRHVHGTLVPPYARLLAVAGVDYREERRERELTVRGIRPRRGGLYYADPDRPDHAGPVLRVAGGTLGDADTLAAAAATAGEGGRVALTIAAAGGEARVSAEVVTVPRVELSLVPRPEPTPAERAVRAGMLRGR